jgi:hypothetical protein
LQAFLGRLHRLRFLLATTRQTSKLAAAPEPPSKHLYRSATVWPRHRPEALAKSRKTRNKLGQGIVHLKAQRGLRMVQKKLDQTNADLAGRPESTLIPPGGEAHDDNKRHHARTEITGLARMAQRTKLVLLDRDHPPIPCKILDASAGGYRVSVATPVPTDAQLALEHTDGKRVLVDIAWTENNTLGLKIIGTES